MKRDIDTHGNDAPNLDALERQLISSLGPVVGGSELTKALGFRSQGAFRQALARNGLPIRVFTIPGRRGRFALTSDIARWLWELRSKPSPASAQQTT